jgi:hypothetical protein
VPVFPGFEKTKKTKKTEKIFDVLLMTGLGIGFEMISSSLRRLYW